MYRSYKNNTGKHSENISNEKRWKI